MKKWLVISALCLLAIVVTVLRNRLKPSDRGIENYEPIHADTGDLMITILSTGTVQPQNRLVIKPPTAGRMESVLVKEGQAIKKGAVLAWMSSSERAVLLDAARAQGDPEYQRWQELYKPTPVVAPLAGTLISRAVEPGQSVNISDTLFVLSDRLAVKALVDETDIAGIALKQRAEIVLDAYPETTIAAQVSHIAYESATTNNVTTYTVDVVPENVPKTMRSGMTANVRFLVASIGGVIRLPLFAIQQENGKQFVKLRRNNNAPLQNHEVVVGANDGKYIEIKEGLSVGDSVWVLSNRSGPGDKQKRVNPLSTFGRRH